MENMEKQKMSDFPVGNTHYLVVCPKCKIAFGMDKKVLRTHLTDKDFKREDHCPLCGVKKVKEVQKPEVKPEVKTEKPA